MNSHTNLKTISHPKPKFRPSKTDLGNWYSIQTYWKTWAVAGIVLYRKKGR